MKQVQSDRFSKEDRTMKKKWLITLVALTMALAAVTGAGFALAGDESIGPAQDNTDPLSPSAMCTDFGCGIA